MLYDSQTGNVEQMATFVAEGAREIQGVDVRLRRVGGDGELGATSADVLWADGIAVGRPGDIPFALIQKYVDDIRVVSEDSLARAQLKLLERSKLVVEPGGAAAVAAIMDDPGSFEPTVVAVLSGGNVDPLVLMRVIRHGLTAGGRFTQFTVHMPDRPGSLAGLLNVIASMDANVVDVSHLRTNPRLAVDEVEITIDLETRGEAHREQLLSTLRDRGYRIVSAQ